MTATVKPQRGLDSIEPYVPGKPIEQVQREYGLKDVVKLASNENPAGPSRLAVAAMSEALDRVNFYPDGQSYYLRGALAERMQVNPDQVIVGNGADGIIMQTCLAYLDQGDEVITSCSSFPIYDIYARVMRATLIKTPLCNYGLDLQAMLAAIGDRTKLVFVCNPNNPTGTMVNAAEVDAFLEKVPENVLVVLDEAYYEFVDSELFPDSLAYVRAGRPNVMVMRTFSKIYGLAGIRLGYAVAQPEILAPLNTIKEPFAVNLLAQHAGLAALQDDECLKASVAANHEGRIYLYREFDRLDLFYLKSHTNFVLVKLGARASQIVRGLLEKGVIIRPGGGYDLPDFARVTVGSRPQNERLVAALEELV
ncbi:MAG: histidinol-phosphate transaminase [Chloroflexi bacterium]|nr:histidinol-phosphate transaminase [Chloroflexota bacterium]